MFLTQEAAMNLQRRVLRFQHLHPRLRISRPTWSRWYRTPNLSRMTRATSRVVQTSDRKPSALGPLRRNFARRRRSPAVSLGGRPGDERTLSASGPPALRASRQRITELGAEPIRRAVSLSDRPRRNNSIARRRRFSRASAGPRGRAMAYYCIIYTAIALFMQHLGAQGLTDASRSGTVFPSVRIGTATPPCLRRPLVGRLRRRFKPARDRSSTL
jgi:hypothetical protein